ncbi:hypothetical protein ACFFJ7_03270 [Pseudochelatococcus lubricantis]|uniref:hypothetical protein n=1 Tax=Pseudochelatococcus lubricantis TaxID=1538102 RepID=UPI0035EB6A12
MSHLGPYRPGGTGHEDRLDRGGSRHYPAGDGTGASGNGTWSGFGERRAKEEHAGARTGAGARPPGDWPRDTKGRETPASLSMRADDFQHRLHQAASAENEGEPSGGSRRSADATGDERVLATCAGTGSTLPLFNAIQQAEATAAAPARLQEALDAIAVRVERAIRAEFAVTPDGMRSLSIDLGGAMNGISAVTIRLSAGGLDIVLAGSGEMFAEDAVHAAQALADRLSKRFGSRTIRVLAAGREAGADEADGDVPASPLADAVAGRAGRLA